jgi:anti-sigma factor RsiW
MPNPKHLTCRQFIEFLHEYFDGNQPPDIRATFEAHLRACPDCRTYLQTYRHTIKLARAAVAVNDKDAVDSVPPALINAVLHAMHSARG